MKHLASAHALARSAKAPQAEFMCLLAQAQMAFDRGDDRSGLAFLRKALSLGREKGYVNTYYWQPAVMASLCQKGLEAGMEVGYVQTIIRKRSLMPDPSPYECDLWPWPLRINTLGRFAVVKDGEPVQFPVRAPRKVLSLLKALIAFGRDGASEEPLIDTLWPDADGDTAQQTLDTTLHRLRQLLGDEKLLQHREGHLRLDRRACMVDAHTFEALLERGEAAPSLDLIEKALALYQGPFLGSDLGEPWAVSYRERLRSKFLRAARRLGNQLEKTGQTDQAIEGYQKALEVDGLAEEFYRHLMVCYASQGRRADALATYERCRRTLQLALGIEPSAETTAIYESIRFSSPKTAPAKSPAR